MSDDTLDDEDAVYIPGPKLRTRYGVTDMTIWRWLHDEEMEFPKPVYLGRNRYWRLYELRVWERSRPRNRSAKSGNGEAA